MDLKNGLYLLEIDDGDVFKLKLDFLLSYTAFNQKPITEEQSSSRRTQAELVKVHELYYLVGVHILFHDGHLG